MAEIKDFTQKRSRILFRIDDDVFEAASALPAEILIQFSEKFSDVGEKISVEIIREALEMVLVPESHRRLSERMRDLGSPVDIQQLSDVLTWLLEQYGGRPTQPASSSPVGAPSPASGTSSTADSSATVSISELSLTSSS